MPGAWAPGLALGPTLLKVQLLIRTNLEIEGIWTEGKEEPSKKREPGLTWGLQREEDLTCQQGKQRNWGGKWVEVNRIAHTRGLIFSLLPTPRKCDCRRQKGCIIFPSGDWEEVGLLGCCSWSQRAIFPRSVSWTISLRQAEKGYRQPL